MYSKAHKGGLNIQLYFVRVTWKEKKAEPTLTSLFIVPDAEYRSLDMN